MTTTPDNSISHYLIHFLLFPHHTLLLHTIYISMFHCINFNVRMHRGSVPLHSPEDRQFLKITSPGLMTNPVLQTYVALDPTVWPLTKMVALSGSARRGHMAAARKYNGSLSLQCVYSVCPLCMCVCVCVCVCERVCECVQMQVLTDTTWKLPTPLLVSLANSHFITFEPECLIARVYHDGVLYRRDKTSGSIFRCTWIATVNVCIAVDG